jgi:hypothetical protein
MSIFVAKSDLYYTDHYLHFDSKKDAIEYFLSRYKNALKTITKIQPSGRRVSVYKKEPERVLKISN